MTRCTSRAGVSARKRQKPACSVAWAEAVQRGQSDDVTAMLFGDPEPGRQLYTDQDKVLFDAARPIILNGIEDVVSRPDLADHALFLTLLWVLEARRRPEQKLWQDFELARSRLRGRCPMG
jgi:hypothetical protein